MIILSVIPMLAFLTIAISLALFCKRSFGECIPVTLLGSTFLVYFSQLFFKTYHIGIGVIALAAFILIPVLILKRKSLREQVSSVFSAGFVSFVFLVILFSILDYKRHFNNWDEYMTWGTMVKESLRLDSFHIVPESNLLNHKEYPPFATVFEVIWCSFCGTYSEGVFTQALHVLQLSLVFPLITEKLIDLKSDGKKWVKILEVIAVNTGLILIVLAFDSDGSRIMSNSLVDILFPLMFVYCVIVILDSKDFYFKAFDVVAIVLGGSGLLLVKQVSIAFLLLIWFLLALVILRSVIRKDKKAILNQVITLAALVIVPFLVNKSWGIIVNKYGIKGQFDLGKIDPKVYLESIIGDNGIQSATFRSYIRGLYSIDVNNFNFMLVTYVSAFFIFLIIAALLIWKSKTPDEKSKMVMVFLTLVAGTLGYAFLMSIMYLFCFTEEEMARLASFHRYMSSYVIAEVLILVYLVLLKFKNFEKINTHTLIIGFTSIGLLLGSTNISYFIPQSFIEFSDDDKKFEDYAVYLVENTEPNSKVFIVAESNNMYQFYIGYYADERHISMDYTNIFGFDFNNEEAKQKLLQEISDNDYIFFIDFNDNIRDNMAPYTIDGNLECNHVYKVVSSADGLSFE